MTRRLRSAALLLTGALPLSVSSCAVLTIDVDVYKGPLANERSVQLDQAVVLAEKARPLLTRLRNRAEKAARERNTDLFDEQKKRATELTAELTAMAVDGTPADVSKLELSEDPFTSEWKEYADRPVPEDLYLTDFVSQAAHHLNQLLALYVTEPGDKSEIYSQGGRVVGAVRHPCGLTELAQAAMDRPGRDTHLALEEALLRYADEMLSLANNEAFFAAPRGMALGESYRYTGVIPGILENLQAVGWIEHVGEDDILRPYVAILQAIGNSIVNHVNEHRAHENRLARLTQLEEKDRRDGLDWSGATTPPLRTTEDLDEGIARLRAQYSDALVKASSGESEAERAARAERLKVALAESERLRADLVEIRPALPYLRSSFPASTLQGRSTRSNLLDEHWNTTLPWYDHFKDGAEDEATREELDKQFWQPVNQIRVAAPGDTNYVVVKDDVGNFYVHQFESDPKPIIDGAAALARFAASRSVGADLVNVPTPKTGEGLEPGTRARPMLTSARIAQANTFRDRYVEATARDHALVSSKHGSVGTDALGAWQALFADEDDADVREVGTKLVKILDKSKDLASDAGGAADSNGTIPDILAKWQPATADAPDDADDAEEPPESGPKLARKQAAALLDSLRIVQRFRLETRGRVNAADLAAELRAARTRTLVERKKEEEELEQAQKELDAVAEDLQEARANLTGKEGDAATEAAKHVEELRQKHEAASSKRDDERDEYDAAKKADDEAAERVTKASSRVARAVSLLDAIANGYVDSVVARRRRTVDAYVNALEVLATPSRMEEE